MTVATSAIVFCRGGACEEELLRSLLAQSARPAEVLLAGTDEAISNVAGSWSSDQGRPECRNVSVSSDDPIEAWNAGLRAARGPYVCFLDGHTVLAPAFIEKAEKVLAHAPSIAFVACRFQRDESEFEQIVEPGSDLIGVLADPLSLSRALIRRDIAIDAGAFDGTATASAIAIAHFWISILERGHTGIAITDVLFRERIADDSLVRWPRDGGGARAISLELTRRHRNTFEAHLLDVLAAKDGRIREILETNYALQSAIAAAGSDGP